MQRTLPYLLIGLISLGNTSHAAKEILLRLLPASDAPVIAKITASEKVILDARPAPTNAEQGWRQLALPTPFEGYVPIAALKKDLITISEGTRVHYLPLASSAEITQVENGDRYEVVRVKEEWATVRFRKNITGYFIDDSTEQVVIDFNAIEVPLVSTKPAAVIRPTPITIPAPIAIPAPRTRINPDEPIGQLDPNALPPENVVWQAAVNTKPQPQSSIHTTTTADRPSLATPPYFQEGLMVGPGETQAREAAPELRPAKSPRLLTGTLVREISVDGPSYPIRLKSPAGRLIAYVDFSGIYIRDLSPYIGQKVYIRGQVYPLPNTRAQVVILAASLRIAD